MTQRTDADCAVCSLATLLGRPYGAVLATVGDAFDPEEGLVDLERALRRLGLRFGVDYVIFDAAPDLAPADYPLVRPYVWGRRALLVLKSLNHPAWHHMVVWTGRRVLDPCPRRTHEATPPRELRAGRFVVFSETGLPARD